MEYESMTFLSHLIATTRDTFPALADHLDGLPASTDLAGVVAHLDAIGAPVVATEAAVDAWREHKQTKGSR